MSHEAENLPKERQSRTKERKQVLPMDVVRALLIIMLVAIGVLTLFLLAPLACLMAVEGYTTDEWTDRFLIACLPFSLVWFSSCFSIHRQKLLLPSLSLPCLIYAFGREVYVAFGNISYDINRYGPLSFEDWFYNCIFYFVPLSLLLLMIVLLCVYVWNCVKARKDENGAALEGAEADAV